jgi:hypothetical protein
MGVVDYILFFRARSMNRIRPPPPLLRRRKNRSNRNFGRAGQQPKGISPQETSRPLKSVLGRASRYGCSLSWSNEKTVRRLAV